MNQPPGPLPVASPKETRSHYLEQAKRDFAPIRRDFVQRPPGSDARPGPLAEFVRNGDERGLLAYLFIVAITSSDLEDAGWSWTLNSSIWARALGTTQSASSASALTAVTRILSRLQKRNLVMVERIDRTQNIRVTLLREDGSGLPYTRPGANGNRDPYLKLPFAFWKRGHDDVLKLPSLAMLLALSCERRGCRLPAERMPKWYGWSADTAERGFKGLSDNQLLAAEKKYESAPATPAGFTEVNLYTLREPYAHRTTHTGKGRAPVEGPIT